MRQNSNLKARVTVVTNEFIDEYMPAANGEYVKVYLYLLRHEERAVEIAEIADALNHTEADVKRALGYWEKAGVLVFEPEDREIQSAAAMTAASLVREAAGAVPDRISGEIPAGTARPQGDTSAAAGRPLTPPEPFLSGGTAPGQPPSGEAAHVSQAPEAFLSGETVPGGTPASLAPPEPFLSGGTAPGQSLSGSTGPDVFPAAGTMPIPPENAGDGCERLERLSGDEEFSALLYAVQQYLGKTFTQVECEKFAFFYDGLHMTGELLEYLAEYCAGGGHTSIRYIEKVALNWYQMGIRTREDAKNHTMRFSKGTASVMKAFGITNRSPGTAEQEYMRKWFREYGFDESLVVEACSRTIKATGAASFPYADKILTGWKESGVRALRDVAELDKKRQKSRSQAAPQPPSKRPASNRFKNFDERSYDYEKYVWEGMRRRQPKGGARDGSQ